MASSNRYGLQLRAPPKQQPVKAAKPPVPAFFNAEDDDDNVEREIARQAAKQRSLREAEEQQKRALEEDPNVFDYDGVYDEMKAKQARPQQQRGDVKREAKYIPHLIQKAKIREREHDIIYEKQLAKERAKEDHLYEDKEKFVTSAYKRKLAEQQKWLEEERLREIKEKNEEVTKREDLSDFYRNLTRNVAFGGGGEAAAQPNTSTVREEKKGTDPAVLKKDGSRKLSSPAPSDTEAAAPVIQQQTEVKRSSRESTPPGKEEIKQAAPSSTTETQEQIDENQSLSEEQARKSREEAARERYLARKRLKQG